MTSRYDTVYYLRENQERFPGVSVERVYVRHYPQGTLAAHVLGYVGQVDDEELKDPRYEALEPGDQVGQDGRRVHLRQPAARDQRR